MDYELLVGSTPDELSEIVSDYLHSGWTLAGIHQVTTTLVDISGHPLEGSWFSMFTQAVTKK